MSEISSVPVKEFCPLGRECVEEIDGVKHVCRWHIDYTTTKPDARTFPVIHGRQIWSPTRRVEFLTIRGSWFTAMRKATPNKPKAYRPKCHSNQ